MITIFFSNSFKIFMNHISSSFKGDFYHNCWGKLSPCMFPYIKSCKILTQLLTAGLKHDMMFMKLQWQIWWKITDTPLRCATGWFSAWGRALCVYITVIIISQHRNYCSQLWGIKCRLCLVLASLYKDFKILEYFYS